MGGMSHDRGGEPPARDTAQAGCTHWTYMHVPWLHVWYKYWRDHWELRSCWVATPGRTPQVQVCGAAKDVTDSIRQSHVLTLALTPTFSHNPVLRGHGPLSWCVSNDLNLLLFFSLVEKLKYFLGNKSINTSSAGQTEHVARLSKKQEKKTAKAPGIPL